MTATLGGVVGERPVGGVSSRARGGVGEGYRPHLDGLRAVAVYLVVLFHAGADAVSGGFIGVDVFFVLSGYLVTQLLMRDLVGRGRLRFGRFYARRMRRLLPASFVLLIVTAVVYSALASPAEIVKVVGAFKAAFLYVANWYFIRQSSDYFGADINTNPVIHFWSLAIEEQFYLVWPLLLGGLFAFARRWGRHARRVMQGVVAVAGLASLVWALSLVSSNVNRAYYGTDARAYQLLAGALLALSPGLVRRAARFRGTWVVAGVALFALLVLASSLIDVNPIRRGVGATIATAVLIVAIEAARRGPVNGVLSCAPAVYLGKISYGTYLWHWPVILVALQLTGDSMSPLSLFGIAAFVATGLASLSYTILERPIREQRLLDRVNPLVIGVGLTITVVSALVVIPYILDPFRAHAETTVQNRQGGGATAGATGTGAAPSGFTPIPDLDFATVAQDIEHISKRPQVNADLKDVPFLPQWNCIRRPSSDCTIVKGGKPHILVIGDSSAWMMFPAFAKLAKERNLTLSTMATGGCPWSRRLYYSEGPDGPRRIHNCIELHKDLYDRVIPELKPDLIVAISNDYLTERKGVVYDEHDEPMSADSPEELQAQVKADTASSLKQLEKLAPKVLLVDPIPITTYDNSPFECLTKSTVLEQCRFVANDQPKILERIYRSLADERKVYVADFDKLACPYLPICDPVIGGQIVRFDNQHLTPRFSETLAEPIAAFLQAERLIPG